MSYLKNIYIKVRNLKDYYPYNPNKIHDFLLKSQYWDKNSKEIYQIELFKKLLNSATKSIFYNSKYKNIDMCVDFDCINNLPVISKEDYQSDSNKFISGDIKKGFVHASSGSTGKPTKIIISKKAEAYRKASVMRFRSWWGLKPEDRLISFTAYPRSEDSILKRIKNYFNPKLDVNIFSINQKNIFNIYANILNYKPKYFRGYVSSIKELGVLFKANELDAKVFKIKVVIVTSEILYDTDRKIIEEIFGCKVANEYGCAEGGLIAYECTEGGMHIQEEMILLLTNAENEIISTELTNDLTPLINYKIGDKVLLSDTKCSCGRNLRLIERIEGRIGSDDIIKPDGSKMNYLFFDKMIKNLSDTELWGKIKRFQIIQDGNAFNIFLIKGDDYSEKISEYIITYIKDGISNDVNVNIIYADKIAPEKSGKFRIFKRKK